VTISDMGEVTDLSSPKCGTSGLPSNCSLADGNGDASSGHKLMPITARTVSNRRASSPGVTGGGHPIGDQANVGNGSIRAAARLVTASATAYGRRLGHPVKRQRQRRTLTQGMASPV